MLDLTKVAREMQGLSQHLSAEATASRQRLQVAQKLLEEAYTRQAELAEQIEEGSDLFIFYPPIPVEPLDTCVEIPVPPKAHTVIATDGSQIAPSHHEIAYCYLINIGRVMLHYGQGRHPLLDSLPEVFYRPEDLYVSRQWGIRTEEWMGYRRTVSEALVLSELATDWAKSQVASSASENKEQENHQSEIANPKLDVPTLAMVDGSLLYWFLDELPTEAIAHIIPPIMEAWEQMRRSGIPLLGYLSASRSSESLSFLRLQACTYSTPNCMAHCNHSQEKTPCQVFDPLRDIIFWASRLQPGQRGPLWRSTNKIINLYGDAHKIYFCYVHVGSEIARIEMPAWVAENSALLDLSLGLMLAQIQKGDGYPIVLSEAHNHAVVKGADRARFFALLEQQMIKAGLKNVGTSYKETRKRSSIA
ncbi:DNA double-strand break repair nuclease NurA [Aerosakkonema funiforme]|uniref:DNA double-strand break repair nuclease NurA n=1 Tax=Aerosakkonema funiforme TaxID=1246630 RepID=UPI0035B6DA9E